MFPYQPRLYKLWVNLSGEPSQFPLHARIFHSTCLISIFALCYNVPFNYFIGLPLIALASLIVLIACFGLYYASRFRKHVESSIFLVNVLGLALFTVLYFLNSGQQGPTTLFFLLFLLLSIAISPVKQYKFWIFMNVLLVMSLHTFEYLNPDVIPLTYTTRLSQFVDVMSAYVVVAAMAYFCTVYVRTSYEKERQSALDKSLAIEEKNEQIVRQNQELEKLNAEKNKLMSIVAHDLRSPLATIQNFLELLTQYDMEEKQKLEIERDLLASTKNTLAMLSKLLDWSKSQLHGLSPRLENLHLATLLDSALLFEKDIAIRKGISLEYDLDDSTEIVADSDMMHVIFRNLVGNAIKFTAGGGTIRIASEVRDGQCHISIQDNGVGISPERQASLFSLDVRSTYGTKNEKGAGLGLMLCMEFISAQNGTITFDSYPQVGTCFYIAIPAPMPTLASCIAAVEAELPVYF